jgi:FtsH-binding integral membrane protein
MAKYVQENGQPTQKVWAASAAALVVPLILAAVKAKWPQIPLPIDADELLGVIVMAALTGGSTALAAYMKRPGAGDGVKPDQNQ